MGVSGRLTDKALEHLFGSEWVIWGGGGGGGREGEGGGREGGREGGGGREGERERGTKKNRHFEYYQLKP